MQWSKLKSMIEERFCQSLKNRVKIYSTRYRGTHDKEGKGWIVVDKKEIFDACTMKWMIAYYGLSNELREINNCTDFTNKEHQEGYYRAYDEAELIVKKRGIYSQYGFYSSLEEYLSLSIEEAMNSDNVIIKGLSMIDKRLGKRRLKDIHLSQGEHAFVKRLYKLRCEAENI
jgi:hypothetical protein